ncbi:MAG: hypothetical protein WC586_03510 [Methanoregula sp.]
MNRYPNLTIIPYVSDYAEFAARTRAEILQRKGSDFIIAVDLPQGLEEEIIKAVRSLPETSLIVDALKRGILITPTSAPVEAVRSYLEYGYALHCIDASLPVTGTMSDYTYFIGMCRLHGPEKVIARPGDFGIPEGDLFRAWADCALPGSSPTPAFLGLPRQGTPADGQAFDAALLSPYHATRLQCMAMHLKELLQKGVEVLFVCSRENVDGVLFYLKTDQPSFDDSYRLPVRTCRVPEKMLFALAREIPFVTYAYELFRDIPFDREKWIRHLFLEECGPVSPHQMTGAIEYAFRLALADSQAFPGLYNITAAAKYFLGDAFAYRAYEKAIAYPPSRNLESNCTFKSVVDYNLNPLKDERVLTLQVAVLDKRLTPINRKTKQVGSPSAYNRFTRTRQSLQGELDLVKFLRTRFRSSTASGRETAPVRFSSGLQSGIDFRQTIRHTHLGRIYVKEPAGETNTCYILDFRSGKIPPKKAESVSGGFRIVIESPPEDGWPTHIFLDKHYPWIGTAHHRENHYTTKVMAGFLALPFSPTKIFENIGFADPLPAAVRIGMKYADRVVVFSDNPGDLKNVRVQPGRLKTYPLQALPRSMQEKMRTFDIVGYRYDDKPGD